MGSTRFCSHAPHKSHALLFKARSFRAWRFFFAENCLFVIFVPHFVFHNVLLCAFRFFLKFFFLCQDWVHFWPKANTLNNWRFVHLVFHLAQNFFVCGAIKRVIFAIIACVVQMFAAFHILVHIVSLYFQQKAVCICVYMSSLLAPYCYLSVL